MNIPNVNIIIKPRYKPQRRTHVVQAEQRTFVIFNLIGIGCVLGTGWRGESLWYVSPVIHLERYAKKINILIM